LAFHPTVSSTFFKIIFSYRPILSVPKARTTRNATPKSRSERPKYTPNAGQRYFRNKTRSRCDTGSLDSSTTDDLMGSGFTSAEYGRRGSRTCCGRRRGGRKDLKVFERRVEKELIVLVDIGGRRHLWAMRNIVVTRESAIGEVLSPVHDVSHEMDEVSKSTKSSPSRTSFFCINQFNLQSI
jgi:hypothetical protein